MRVAAELLNTCLIAFGVVIGGSLFAGLAAVLFGRLPVRTMAEVADRLKLWGTFAALGGTIATFKSIESGIFAGELGSATRQALHLLIAFGGAHLGFLLIQALAAGE